MIEHLEWNLYMYLYMVIFGIHVCKLKILKCTVPGKASKKMMVFYNDLENMSYFA